MIIIGSWLSGRIFRSERFPLVVDVEVGGQHNECKEDAGLIVHVYQFAAKTISRSIFKSLWSSSKLRNPTLVLCINEPSIVNCQLSTTNNYTKLPIVVGTHASCDLNNPDTGHKAPYARCQLKVQSAKCKD